MSRVVDALVGVMQTGKPRKKPDPVWAARAATATGDAKKLLDAVAGWKQPTWELGARFIVGGTIPTFAGVQGRGGPKRLPFDVEKSCELGCSYAPHITWGFHWDGIELEFIEITDGDNKVHRYTPEAWFANLRAYELAVWAQHGRDPGDDLVSFAAACGAPIDVPPKPKKPKKQAAKKR